jgi:dUTP pyrophosphatase
MKFYRDPGARTPTKAYETDGGWDLYSRDKATIYPGESAVFDTGIHTMIPRGFVGLVESKSGLNIKHGILAEAIIEHKDGAYSTGVVDHGYLGSIVVKLYNFGTEPYTVNDGDKISQLVVVLLYGGYLTEVNSIDELGSGERGFNGFGSSGR